MYNSLKCIHLFSWRAMTNRVTWITSGIQSVFSASSTSSASNPNTSSRRDNSGERVAPSSRSKRISTPVTSESINTSGSFTRVASDSRISETQEAMMNSVVSGPRPPPYEEIASTASNDGHSERRRSSLYSARINITRGVNNSSRMREASVTSGRSSNGIINNNSSTGDVNTVSATTTTTTSCTGSLSNGLRVPVTASNNGNVNTTCDVRRALNGVWASRGSSLMGCFFCCVNFYTLSRFSLLAYFFKGKCTTSTKAKEREKIQ